MRELISRIPLNNATELAKLPPDEQPLLLFEAQNFPPKAFRQIIIQWQLMHPERREAFAQVLKDLENAFEEWDSWSGNQIGDDIEKYEEMVKAARLRVLRYIHSK